MDFRKPTGLSRGRLFDFAVGTHHGGLAPERNRERSIGHQVDAWNVGMMDPLRFIPPAFQLLEDRQASFLAPDEPMLIAGIFQFTLDASLLIIPKTMSARPVLPLGCTFCASMNLHHTCTMHAKRSAPGCNANAL